MEKIEITHLIEKRLSENVSNMQGIQIVKSLLVFCNRCILETDICGGNFSQSLEASLKNIFDYAG